MKQSSYLWEKNPAETHIFYSERCGIKANITHACRGNKITSARIQKFAETCLSPENTWHTSSSRMTSSPAGAWLLFCFSSLSAEASSSLASWSSSALASFFRLMMAAWRSDTDVFKRLQFFFISYKKRRADQPGLERVQMQIDIISWIKLVATQEACNGDYKDEHLEHKKGS